MTQIRISHFPFFPEVLERHGSQFPHLDAVQPVQKPHLFVLLVWSFFGGLGFFSGIGSLGIVEGSPGNKEDNW